MACTGKTFYNGEVWLQALSPISQNVNELHLREWSLVIWRNVREWRNGRRARLRILWVTVGVQVPPLAPIFYFHPEAGFLHKDFLSYETGNDRIGAREAGLED